jgi:hypothetical protein
MRADASVKVKLMTPPPPEDFLSDPPNPEADVALIVDGWR